MREETIMTEKQKAVLEASDLELLDELKNGNLLVRDTEAMAIRGVYFCYIMSHRRRYPEYRLPLPDAAGGQNRLSAHRGNTWMPALLQSLLMDGDDAARAGAALPVLRRRATQALTIYVHIPFCIQKCGYCDFNAYLYRRDAAQTYLSALRREIEHTASERPWMSYHVPSVYFGGGTPSTLAPADLTSLLRLIRDSFPVSADAEITLEADPGTIDLAGLEALRAGGFNRISIGVQAFDDGLLHRLDRLHSAADARSVARLGQTGGIHGPESGPHVRITRAVATRLGEEPPRGHRLHPDAYVRVWSQHRGAHTILSTTAARRAYPAG